MEWNVWINSSLLFLKEDDNAPLYVGIGAAIFIVVGMTLYRVIKKAYTGLKRAREMKKRAKLSKEVREIIEDHIVCAFSEAIASKRITLDDARELYAKYAHLGFWGLHPRKFVPKKTKLDLEELKQQLKEKRAAREASNNQPSALDKLLEGID